jgi:predicted metal-dependent phosphoesterase TrpH
MHKTGIIHVHSTLSYDGRHSLEELAALGRQRGYGFVGITEHSDTMDVAKMAHLVAECERLSDHNVKLIPGIEFTCENDLHLIGLGVEQYADSKDPVWLAGFIRDHGGVSIIAHPSRYNYEIPVALTNVIDGIEIWNANYDGRFIPNDRSITLWQERRLQNWNLVATGGQDLHVITGHVHVALTVDCEELTCGAILGAIRKGCFRVSNSYCTVPVPSMSRSTQMAIGWARHAYLKAKTIREWLLAGTR